MTEPRPENAPVSRERIAELRRLYESSFGVTDEPNDHASLLAAADWGWAEHDRAEALAAEVGRLRDVSVIRCPECDAGEPCQVVRESGAIARPETGDGAEDAPCPMRDEPAPSSDDPHGACSRNLVAVAVERDKARAAAAAASGRHEDDLRRLLDCREVVRSLTDERDAARASLAALVADLRAAEAEWHDAWSSVALDDNEAPVLRQVALAWLSARAIVRALLDRHAPEGGR